MGCTTIDAALAPGSPPLAAVARRLNTTVSPLGSVPASTTSARDELCRSEIASPARAPVPPTEALHCQLSPPVAAPPQTVTVGSSTSGSERSMLDGALMVTDGASTPTRTRASTGLLCAPACVSTRSRKV